MIEQDTLESRVKYGESLLNTIKTHQTTIGSRLVLTENTGGSIVVSMGAYALATVRIIFTPNNPDNLYSQAGVFIWCSPYSAYKYMDFAIYSDPTYISSSSQAWLVRLSNGDGVPISVSVQSTIVSASSGSVSMAVV